MACSLAVQDSAETSLSVRLEKSGWQFDVLYLRMKDGDVANSAALDM